MRDQQEKIYLNKSLAKRMPFLFIGKNPADPQANFAKKLMQEHSKIGLKMSNLTVAQRKIIKEYVKRISDIHIK